MPNYSGTYAVPRVDIGGAMEEYQTTSVKFIGLQALPVLPVDAKSGTFSAITRESLTRRRKTARAQGGNYNRDTFAAKDVSYDTSEQGFEVPLDDSEARKFDMDFDSARLSAQLAMDIVLREQEIRIAAALFNTSTWTGAAYYTDVSANPWATSTTNVVAQINAAKIKVFNLTGIEPRTLICSWKNAMYLWDNDDFAAKLAGVTVPTPQMVSQWLAQLLNLDQVLVGNGIYNSADEGQTMTAANIWSDTYAMLAVTAGQGAPSRMPCVGRSPLWRSDSPNNVMVERYRDETIRSEVFRVRQYVGEKVIDKSFAHLLKVA